MTNQAKLEALRDRQALALRATLMALGLVGLATLGMLTHVETGSGAQIQDVHIPTIWLDGFSPALFGTGEPHDAATGYRLLIRWIVVACFAASQLFAIGLGFWALKTKRKQLATLATILFLASDVLSPVPKVFVAATDKAVSVETAQRLLTAKQDAETLFKLADKFTAPLKVYVRAQIAYIRGDKATARKFSAGLTDDNVASAIEGPYRLQFLQDRYRGVTTVCFTRVGCLNEEQRQWRFNVFAGVAAILATACVTLLSLCLFLTQRLTLVEALAAKARTISSAKRLAHPVAATAS